LRVLSRASYGRAMAAIPAPHPIELTVTGDLARSRATVFFRGLLVIPHLLFLYVWALAAGLTMIVAWVAALFIGHVPGPLHRFLAAYLRYVARVNAYLLLIANPYPPFSGAEGRGVVDVAIEPAARQSRWKILFRFLLAYPALLLVKVFQSVNFTIAFLGWFYCLVTGRMEPGMQRLNALLLRYEVQALGYIVLLTDRYPRL
jgi:Domain of unknown function (DUF4389)